MENSRYFAVIFRYPYSPSESELDSPRVRTMNKTEEQTNTRVSIDLRGSDALAFMVFRDRLSKELGFDISASKAILWAMKKSDAYLSDE